MATVNIYGGPFVFVVTAVGAGGAPAVGVAYTNNGATFKVVSSTISGGTGTITMSSNGAATPSASGTLTRSTGTGYATITFSSYTAANDVNISNIDYATGDTLSINNGVNSFVRLTIDAQVAADVTKLGAALPALMQASSVVGEVYVVNTSATVPLVVKMNGELQSSFQGPGAKFKVRGDFISIGTGSGADNQTISSTVGGVALDWIPYIEVETASGSGVYSIYLNIGGAYNDLSGAAYGANARSFSDCGTTIDNGCFFEFDEQGGTIHFGSVAAGHGRPPPNGSNIRIPNIHFTGSATRPTAALGSRCRFTTQGSVFDIEKCNFSDRWGIFGAQFQPSSWRMNHVGHIPSASGPVNINGPLSIDYWGISTDPYTAIYGAGNSNNTITTASGSVSIDHVAVVSSTDGSIQLLNMVGPTIGEIRAHNLNKTGAFQYPISLSNIVAPNNAPINVGPLYCNGGSLNPINCNNVRVNGLYFSDRANGTFNATAASSVINGGNNSNLIIQTIRLLSGGVVSASGLTGTWTNFSQQVAIHDVLIDGASHMTTIFSIPGSRMWYANIELTNMVTSNGMPFNSASVTASYPARLCNYYSNTSAASLLPGGAMIEQATATGINGAASYDASVVHLIRTTGKTVGSLYLAPFVRSLNAGEVVVNSGTYLTDYTNNGTTLILPGNGVQITYTPARPIRGVSSVGSASFPTPTGASATSGVTYEFRLRNYNPVAQSWSAWTTLNAANFISIFGALSGYSSNTGFEVSFRVTTTTAVAGRTFVSAQLNGLTLDSSFTAPEIGFVQVGITGAVVGSTGAVFENTTPASPVLKGVTTVDSTGAYQFEFPYMFDGSVANFKTLVRYPGYREEITASTCYQAGASVPAAAVAAYATTNADIDAAHIVIDGAAKTITMSATHTIDELYQRCQWWSCQAANITYDIPLTSNDGVSFTGATGWGLILTGCTLNGSGTVTLTGNITMSGGAVSHLPISAANAKSAVMTLTGLSAHAVYLENGAGSQVDYQSSVTGTYTAYIDSNASGTWTWVVKKAGYKGAYSDFDPTVGGRLTYGPSTPQDFQPDGSAMYQGTSSGLCTVSFTGTTEADILIGDGTVGVQAAYDTTERALVTNPGMIWQAGYKTDTSIATLIAGNFLFMTTGWRLKALAAGQSNTAVGAFVFSTDGTPVNGANGPVAYLSSSQLTQSDIQAAMTAQGYTTTRAIEISTSAAAAAQMSFHGSYIKADVAEWRDVTAPSPLGTIVDLL